MGRVIWADLEEDPAFLEQITSGYPLDRTSFYVDMAGEEAVRYSQEEWTENHVIISSNWLPFWSASTAPCLGSRSGIFPLSSFPPVRREKARQGNPASQGTFPEVLRLNEYLNDRRKCFETTADFILAALLSSPVSPPAGNRGALTLAIKPDALPLRRRRRR